MSTLLPFSSRPVGSTPVQPNSTLVVLLIDAAKIPDRCRAGVEAGIAQLRDQVTASATGQVTVLCRAFGAGELGKVDPGANLPRFDQESPQRCWDGLSAGIETVDNYLGTLDAVPARVLIWTLAFGPDLGKGRTGVIDLQNLVRKYRNLYGWRFVWMGSGIPESYGDYLGLHPGMTLRIAPDPGVLTQVFSGYVAYAVIRATQTFDAGMLGSALVPQRDQRNALDPKPVAAPVPPLNWDDVEQALQRHDWYYDRSDDSRVYAAGQASWSAISALLTRARRLDASRADGLLARYRPAP